MNQLLSLFATALGAAPPAEGLFAGTRAPSRPIEPERVLISSITNDNRSFRIHFATRAFLWGNPFSYLRVREQTWSGTWGQIATGDPLKWTSFDIDAETAYALSERYQATLQRRADLGGSLRLRFASNGSSVQLRIENEGAAIGLWVNGIPTANSGGYGQLTFHVYRDGQEIASPALGGLYVGPVVIRMVTPDAPLVIDTDLASLFPLRSGETYEVRCRYDGIAVPGPQFPPYPGSEHLYWTVIYEETLNLVLP